jgi:hypothetical protein
MAQWFVLLITLAAATSTIASYDALPAYDSFVVAVYWPPAICRPASLCSPPSTNTSRWKQLFLLRSLWPHVPRLINRPISIYCPGPDFNISLVNMSCIILQFLHFILLTLIFLYARLPCICLFICIKIDSLSIDYLICIRKIMNIVLLKSIHY